MLSVGILYFSTACHTSCGSNFGVSTVVRPLIRPLMVPHSAAPCMSGAMTTAKPASAGASAAAFANSHSSSDADAGVEVDQSAEDAQHVFLAPHHTLRHAGGTAGVQDVDVVVGTLTEVALRAPRRERVLVVDRAERRGVGARAVVDRDEVPQHRQRIAHGRDARRVLRVVHEGDEIGVVEEVAELGLDVAVVHVHGNRAQLVGREDRLDERVAVHAVDADVIALADALRLEVVRQPVRPLLELGVGAGLVGDDQGDPIGDACRRCAR